MGVQIPRVGQVWVPVHNPDNRYLILAVYDVQPNGKARHDLWPLGNSLKLRKIIKGHSFPWGMNDDRVRIEEMTDEECPIFAQLMMGIEP